MKQKNGGLKKQPSPGVNQKGKKNILNPLYTGPGGIPFRERGFMIRKSL
jgi:hypothetical protein